MSMCLGQVHLEGGPEADTENSGGITSPVFLWKGSVLQEELEQVAPTCWNHCNLHLSIFTMFSPCMYDIFAWLPSLSIWPIVKSRLWWLLSTTVPLASRLKCPRGKQVGQSGVGTTKRWRPSDAGCRWWLRCRLLTTYGDQLLHPFSTTNRTLIMIVHLRTEQISRLIVFNVLLYVPFKCLKSRKNILPRSLMQCSLVPRCLFSSCQWCFQSKTLCRGYYGMFYAS